MGFKKMTQQQYPPRLWTLVGYPGSGKSTFATQMRGPILAIDADNRFREVLPSTPSDVYCLSENPSDNADTDQIVALLNLNMAESNVNTIVVDSLTAIIVPLVTQAIKNNDAGRNRNRAAAFKDKALALRQLQDTLTKWGKDVLWIYHFQDGRDGQGKKISRPTISETELSRLTRSINMQLQVVQDGNRRGIKVVWARHGHNQMVIWDESDKWIGMPERIEQAVYGGLSGAEQDHRFDDVPKQFPNIESAIEWAISKDAFTDICDARKIYDELKQKHQPRNATEMARYWTTEVLKRHALQENNPAAGK
jgi:hypothetical protein